MKVLDRIAAFIVGCFSMVVSAILLTYQVLTKKNEK